MEIGQAEDGAVVRDLGQRPKSSTVSECRTWSPVTSIFILVLCLLVLSDSGQVI